MPSTGGRDRRESTHRPRPVPSIEAVLNVKHIGDMAANNDNSFIIDFGTV
jgi:hypothetical protein